MLFFLVLFTSALNIFGQNWPMESSIWFYNETTIFPQHPLSKVSGYTFSKDTIIDDFHCSIIESNQSSDRFVLCDSGGTQLFILLNDSLYPWLDFSLSAGDTMKHVIWLFGEWYSEPIDSFIVISSKISEFVAIQQQDTLYHFKRLTPLSDPFLDSAYAIFTRPYFDYVDSVGFFNQLTFPIPEQPLYSWNDNTQFGFLRCYSDNTREWKNRIFMEYSIEDCAYKSPPVGLNTSPSAQYKISPNPIENEFQISGLNYAVEYSISLRDIHGIKKILQPISKNHFNISYLTSGMYFLWINSEEESKFFKIHKL